MFRLAVVGSDEFGRAYLRNATRLRGASLVAADTAELIAEQSDAFDALVVCSSDVRDQVCDFAMAHRKPLLAPMPIAATSEAVESLIEQCRSQGICLMAGQSGRFTASAMTIKESLAAGQLGEAGLVRIHRWQPRTDKTRDAAELSRDIDLAMWLFKSLPTSVYAVAPSVSKRDPFDFVQVHLGFPEGGMGLLDFSMTLPPGDEYFSLSLIGSRGAAYADDHHNKQLLFAGKEPAALHTADGSDHLLAELQEFVDAIDERREPAVTGEDARNALIVCEAVRESINSGRAATLAAGGRYEF